MKTFTDFFFAILISSTGAFAQAAPPYVSNNSVNLAWAAQDLTSKHLDHQACAVFSVAEEVARDEIHGDTWRELRPCFIRSLLREGRMERAAEEIGLFEKDFARAASEPSDSDLARHFFKNGRLHPDIRNRLLDLRKEFPTHTESLAIITAGIL